MLIEQANTVTTKFYKKMHKALKAAGFSYKRTKHSALEDLVYAKPGHNTIVFCGWHGDGAYGAGRILLNVYVREELGFGKVIDSMEVFSIKEQLTDSLSKFKADGFEQYKARIPEVEEYVLD